MKYFISCSDMIFLTLEISKEHTFDISFNIISEPKIKITIKTKCRIIKKDYFGFIFINNYLKESFFSFPY